MSDKSDSTRYEQSLTLASELEGKAAAAGTSVDELIEEMHALVRLIHEGPVKDEDEIWISGRIANALLAVARRIESERPEARGFVDRMLRGIRPTDLPPID